MIADGKFDQMKADRYKGFKDSAIGKKFASGKASLAEMAKVAAKTGDT